MTTTIPLSEKLDNIIAEIESEVTPDGLIDDSMLKGYELVLETRGEGPGRKTNAYDVTDKQFISWWLAQLDEGFDVQTHETIPVSQRLKVRMLLLMALDYVKELRHSHWREGGSR